MTLYFKRLYLILRTGSYVSVEVLCTLGISSAHIFVADFPPVALRFNQRTRRVRLINLCVTDKKSFHKHERQKIQRAHYKERKKIVSTEEHAYIYVMDEDKIWIKVPFSEIYYFETIKSTHYCEVRMKNGSGRLHADIIVLEKKLPKQFLKTRSSTMVNLDLIQKVDLKQRVIYFEETVWCSFAGRMTKQLKQLFQLKNYRNYREEKA